MLPALFALLPWRRVSAAAAVLMIGYTVSQYAAAAANQVQLATPTQTPAVIVVQGTPVLLVVTATPAPATNTPPATATIPATPTHTTTRTATATSSATPAPPLPMLTLTPQGRGGKPLPPAPTATLGPPQEMRLGLVARWAVSGTAPGPRLAWTGGEQLWVAAGDGLLRASAPGFQVAPGEAWQQQAGLGGLLASPDGQHLAGRATGPEAPGWLAQLATGQFTALAQAALPLAWGSEGQLVVRAGCGSNCLTLTKLDLAALEPQGRGSVQYAPDTMRALPAPQGPLVAYEVLSGTASLVADLTQGNWWYLGGWRDPAAVQATEYPAAWLDGESLLTFHGSRGGGTIAGHGRDLWRWDVRANSGRFLASDVAAVAVAPGGQRLALILLGAPSLDGQGLLAGGYWRPETPPVATLALADLPGGRLRWSHRLSEHDAVTDTIVLAGWPALRTPIWVPDGSAVVAFDGEGRPLLLPIDGRAPLLLAEQPTSEIAWAPDSQHLAMLVGGEVWVVRRELVSQTP
jgi:hypothetical protein